MDDCLRIVDTVYAICGTFFKDYGPEVNNHEVDWRVQSD